MIHVILTVAAAVWLYMTAWFFVALARNDNSLADVAWGPGFVLVTAVTLVFDGGFATRRVLVAGLVVLWAARLAGYIILRKRGRGEDDRYAAWRKRWGRRFVLRSYLQVFCLQGALLVVISSPIVWVNSTAQGPLGLLDLAGTCLWLTGFVFEWVGDAQLARFKRDPANRRKIMTRGLWAFTRHPNYFGEATMWWAFFLLALASPGGWITAAGPAVLTFLLLRVSGVALLEKRYADRPDFRDYARRTSAFIPWFPRKTPPTPPAGAAP
jgi:steroid 5-alpha reductase family enzyme